MAHAFVIIHPYTPGLRPGTTPQGVMKHARTQTSHVLSPPSEMPYASEALFEDLYGNVVVLHERRALPAS